MMNLILLLLLLLLLCCSINDVKGECMHDVLMNKYHNKRGTKEDTNLPVSTQDYNGQLLPTDDNTQPIRIVLDLTHLDNDPYTCYSVGSQVLIANIHFCREQAKFLTPFHKF